MAAKKNETKNTETKATETKDTESKDTESKKKTRTPRPKPAEVAETTIKWLEFLPESAADFVDGQIGTIESLVSKVRSADEEISAAKAEYEEKVKATKQAKKDATSTLRMMVKTAEKAAVATLGGTVVDQAKANAAEATDDDQQ